MLTAAFLNYDMHAMRTEWREQAETDLYKAPLDFGAIDAPMAMPAGSHRRVQSIISPAYQYPLPTATHR